MTVILPRSNEVILDTGLNYYVQNNTTEPLTLPDRKTPLLRWNKVAYRCNPGERVIVPWQVIALYFGDPRSRHDEVVQAKDSQGVHHVPSRGDELFRLSVFYGVYEQGVDILASAIPDVSIYTLDNVEIIPPCFDPDAEFTYGYQRNMQKTGDVATLIDQMERAQADLQAQLDQLKQAQAIREIHGDNDGPIPEDIPSL